MASIGYPEILLAVVLYLLLLVAVLYPLLRRICFGNDVLPWNWPLVGVLPWIFGNAHKLHDSCTELLEQTGCTFLGKGHLFGNMDMLLTSDPANVHYIISSNSSNFDKGPEFIQIFDILGDGIFNSESDLWMKQRKIAQAITSNKQFLQCVVNTTQNKVEKGLVPVLEHGSNQGLLLDLQDLFKRFMFDAFCISIAGFDPNSLSIEFPRVPFAEALEDAQRAIFLRHVIPESLWKLQKWLGIGQEKKHSAARRTIDRVVAEFISKKREELSNGIAKLQKDQEGTDLLTWYLNEDIPVEFKSNESLRDTIVNLLFAGRDTISAALTWFIWLVAKNPSVEAKIREELKEIIPGGEHKIGHIFSANALNNLVYLHAAVCETLRLYPPIPFQHKAPHRADVLPSGHKVHPKMRILFSMYAMGRMTSTWGKDCIEFKPERWITEKGEIKHEPSHKFHAFGAGARTCLGKWISLTQVKAVAAAILYNYNIELVEGRPVAPKVAITLHMKHEFMVRVSKRWP